MRDLKTIVHVESRSRNWRVRKISATPASPLWVARRMCSMYFALGGASCDLISISSSSSELSENGIQGSGRADFDLGGPLHRLLEILRHCSRSTRSSSRKTELAKGVQETSNTEVSPDRSLSTTSFQAGELATQMASPATAVMVAHWAMSATRWQSCLCALVQQWRSRAVD